MKRHYIFALMIVLVMAAMPVLAQPTLTFWNMPFNTQEVSPEYVAWWEENIAKALPDIQADTYYGPGTYDAQRKNFVVQAKTGKPDVIEGLVEDLTVYTKQDIILDLTEHFNNWDEKDQFVESTLKPLIVDGKLYGLPYNTNARVLLYRKDLFEQYGLEVPKTWDEYVKVASVITEKTNKEVFGTYLCTKVGDPRAYQEFVSWFFQVSHKAPVFKRDAEGKWAVNATAEQFAQVLKLYQELVFANADFPALDPNQRGNGWPEEDNGYVAGKWAMVPMGPWIWGHRGDNETARAILEEKTGIASLPVVEGGVLATYLEVKPIMVNKYSKNIEQAWEMAKFITSRDAMAGWAWDSGFIPARKDVSELEQFKNSWWQQGFSAQLPNAVALSPVNWLPPQQSMLEAVNMVIYQKNTPEEAGKWLYDELVKQAEEGLL
ncbi:extracellular solute-binding protein family 1 [Candidatus Vecturithrix granuli]|uniref:Extracellular solute-binding protein family 1 n=1 Tax=Vecturithrix granuli TaxID=1499967 RepID=A0A081C4R6_VECG1|nr:extracellular solute-binding protein family 1 [Candidatus Vecturithrix granuli]